MLLAKHSLSHRQDLALDYLRLRVLPLAADGARKMTHGCERVVMLQSQQLPLHRQHLAQKLLRLCVLSLLTN